jgi:hypothetical protein
MEAQILRRLLGLTMLVGGGINSGWVGCLIEITTWC